MTGARTHATQPAELARSKTGSPLPSSFLAFRAHLDKLDQSLKTIHRRLLASPTVAALAPRAAEWFLDNEFLIAQSLREVDDGLPREFYKRIPVVAEGPFTDVPSICAIARALFAQSDDRFEREPTEQFLEEFQRVRRLRIAELWGVPLALRLVMLEELTKTTEHLFGENVAGAHANETSDAFPNADIRVAACIESLRALSTHDWNHFFENVSHVDRTLRRDPADAYSKMDFESRDRYRKVVEKMADDAKKDEEDVALAAIDLALSAPESKTPRRRHVGYYLVAEGRADLERVLRCRFPAITRLRRLFSGHKATLYLATIVVLSAVLAVGSSLFAASFGAGLAVTIVVLVLGLVPATTLATALVHWVVTQIVPPTVLPKLELEDGVPDEWRTLVVTSILLTSDDEVDAALGQLERTHLASADANILFGLLTDFTDAPDADMPGDEEILERVRRGVRALNNRYAKQATPPFYLFHRERRFNAAEGCWMGWERKRGKITELNRWLRGNTETTFVVIEGVVERLQPIRFVITLDADTELPRTAASHLIGTLAHPLHRPEHDDSGRVVAGYTVLQPRIETSPLARATSRFARIFHRSTGLDLYAHAVSDVYQDLFGEGIYAGKGIFDIDAFQQSLDERIPDNALLSHDLLEGVHGRAGLVSDVAVFEDFPSHYLAYARRLHRWVRGDWLLLPWLVWGAPPWRQEPTLQFLSLVDRFKIADNLRRSLLAPSLVALLAAGWLGLVGPAWLWTAAAIAILAAPLFLESVADGIRAVTRRRHRGSRTLMRSSTHVRTPRGGLRFFLSATFLVHDATVTLDAIARTLIRRFITGRRVLEWVPAAQAERAARARSGMAPFWREMWSSPLFAVVVLILTGLANPAAIPIALPLCLLWASSPYIAFRVSQPSRDRGERLAAADVTELRQLARRTWLFFEEFVGPEDHWLPPDHYQEEPGGVVARRTSPTNIGMHLMAALSAFDLGYLGVVGLASRLRNALGTLDKLERYRGHFLNWYSTRDLESLSPHYVSTVDSGNLAAALVALQRGCRDVASEPAVRSTLLTGLVDTIQVLAVAVTGLEGGANRQTRDTLLDALRKLETRLARSDIRGAGRLVPELLTEYLPEIEAGLVDLARSGDRLPGNTLRQLRIWSGQLRAQCVRLQQEVQALTPWLLLDELPPPPRDTIENEDSRFAHEELARALRHIPTLRNVARFCEQMQASLDGYPERFRTLDAAWTSRLEQALGGARERAIVLLSDLESLSNKCEHWVQQMDFAFLYEDQRHLFHIGYDVASGRLDPHYYDLLASEARLASFLAIAKGDAPVEHWMHLGRPFADVEGSEVLLSWAGTMFEYLLPEVLMWVPRESLLGRSSAAAVHRQMADGHSERVPWGISESGYHHVDLHGNYQYRAFGATGLGINRSSRDRVVVAPYACVLALDYRPRAVLENLRRLTEDGAMGTYGLYEAVDFGPREKVRRKGSIVASYMAHHQGMILSAVCNFLEHGSLRRRFHSDPSVTTAEFLLHEELPGRVPLQAPWLLAGVKTETPPPVPAIEPWRVSTASAYPDGHVLSNGRYSLLVTARGAGGSRHDNVALTRWRSDAVLEPWGTWIYLRDLDSKDVWSAAEEPIPGSGGDALFAPHMVELHRVEHGISVRTQLTVSPDEDLEIRLVSITNQSEKSRRLRIVSYGEVVLATPAEDRRHPAYQKLFVECELWRERAALLFRRRDAGRERRPHHLAHALVTDSMLPSTPEFEVERERFLGRGGNVRRPQRLFSQVRPRDTHASSTLDPIFSIGTDVELLPEETRELAFVTATAPTRGELVRMLDAHRSLSGLRFAFERARHRSEHDLRELELPVADQVLFQSLLAALIFPRPGLRAPARALSRNRRSQRFVWAHGISGELPVLMVHLSGDQDIARTRSLIRAHAYWRRQNVQVDLVLLDEKSEGYAQPAQDRLRREIERVRADAWLHQPGGIHMLFGKRLDAAQRLQLGCVARVIIDAGQDLAGQVARLRKQPERLPAFFPTSHAPIETEITPPIKRPRDLWFDNGTGGFSPDGHEYIIHLDNGSATPAPWINVIANPEFGFLVSESGAGYTWAGNSAENRLTGWHNDPVTDPPSEAVYLRDEETGIVWSATPKPSRAPTAYRTRHGAGYSVFEHRYQGLETRLQLFVAKDHPVKLAELTLTNLRDRERRITATYYAEWTMGSSRDISAEHISVEYDAETEALLARNPFSIHFGERTAFLSASQSPHGITCDRSEFLGRDGNLSRPAALYRIGLSGTAKAGLDPCAALQIHLDIAPGECRTFHFMLGQGKDRSEAIQLVQRFSEPSAVSRAKAEVDAFWDELLGKVQVTTPEPAMNLLLNRWLLYQVIVCRLWARTALYQSSGAFGFRDQLQDVMALLHAAPELARSHILEAARRQFTEGDVLHWWQPHSTEGVRTRCSDDLVWLPYVTATYVAATSDSEILREELPFLTAPPLEPHELERYGMYEPSEGTQTLYQHCLLALERASTEGAHGLPLFGAGDWNDGMNRVGAGGKGESVWLGWFLIDAMRRFAPLCREHGDTARADQLLARADRLADSLEQNGWDGEWYRRGYYDDGSPLGSARDEECRIDSVSQSWCAISGAASPERMSQAVGSAVEHLVREDERLALLLTPPFGATRKDPGYIKNYPPGVRENGGQYTHAGAWLGWALTTIGDGERAEWIFRLLNPILRSSSPQELEDYKVEPYVCSADVYSVPPYVGRGGWTWYTGSAAWLYRLGIEQIVGVKRVAEGIRLEPCIPPGWQQYEIRVCLEGTTSYRIQVENPPAGSTRKELISLDGVPQSTRTLPHLTDGRTHDVVVRLSGRGRRSGRDANLARLDGSKST